MKDSSQSSEILQNEKPSLIAYIISILFLGAAVITVASMMGCSLPY